MTRIPWALVAHALLLLAPGCATAHMTDSLSTTPASDSAPNRYLALGDSYTIGESVSGSQRFPVELTRSLRAQGIAVEEPLIIARTGWTTGELAAAIEDSDPHGPFALVTLLIGVNNQYRGYSPDQYQIEFQDLLRRSIEFAGGEAGRIIVISIPDWGITPFAGGRDATRIAQEIDAFNAINQEETAAAGARYVDVTEISRRAANDGTLLARDKLHPSGKMYALWVEKILVEALLVLKH